MIATAYRVEFPFIIQLVSLTVFTRDGRLLIYSLTEAKERKLQ